MTITNIAPARARRPHGPVPVSLTSRVELDPRARWQDRGNCRVLVAQGWVSQSDMYDLFFPTRTSPKRWMKHARIICSDCPVIDQCAASAMDYVVPENSHGIQAGMTGQERRKMVRRVAAI